jgi:diguanylate cyclase (GGDEF)-like protein/PAS domain S-box-containing protein
MKDEMKTKAQLVEELSILRYKLAAPTRPDTESKLTEADRQQATSLLTSTIEGRLAKEMAVIAEIGRIIGSTLDIDEVYELFVQEVQKLIPSDRLGVSLHSRAEGIVRIAYVFGTDVPGRQKGESFPLEGTLNEMLIRRRTGLLILPKSVEELARSYPTLINNYKAGVRSMMSVPLIARDEVIGVLDFRSKQPNAYTLADLRLAHRIGEQIAGAIAGAQLFAELMKVERSLRESEARFRPLFEQAAVGVAEVDIRTGRFLTVNRRHCEILGMTEEELLASTFHEITYPEDSHLHADKMDQLVAGKIRNYTVEKRYVRKDGAIIWVTITVSPLWKPGEKPERNIAVVEDVTERKRMREEIDRRSMLLTVLHETSLELTAELNLSALLQSITQNALNLIGGVSCRCYLHRLGSDMLDLAASAGTAKIPRRATWKRDEGVVGQVWATGAPLLINDYRAWPGRVRSTYSSLAQAVLGVPIRWGEEFLGVLNIVGELPNQYSQADLDVLGMFATQAAIAIRNVRLYNRIEQVAVTDELTDLLNRRGFSQLGEREFERALRFKRPLAALMFDIDHFKVINDTYGHNTGDQVLRALADCFRRHTRGIDVAGRHGGEEFVLLMPETLPLVTVQIAERLRQSIEDLCIPIVPAESDSPAVNLRITVSIGVAVLWKDAPNLAALVDRADQAQYHAKKSGRNRVSVWEKQGVFRSESCCRGGR